jgi:hypothetical protein
MRNWTLYRGVYHAAVKNGQIINLHIENEAVSTCPVSRPAPVSPIRDGWSHYTDTSEPVDGNGALEEMVTSRRLALDEIVYY